MLKDRADKILADLKLVASRSQAKSLIEKGDVLVNGNVLLKASELICSDDHIEIKSPLFVGRGAFKLEKALEVFPIEVKDLTLMDVGASTGGFTEVLLQKGAKKVFAIDVGHDQLAKKLQEDPRVINLEGTNIKDLKTLPDLIEGAVMDLSFISMTKVLESIHGLMKEGAFLIALVKPQFEAGPERLPKDGVVKDQKIRDQILNEVIQFSETHGWKHHQSIISPIEGKNGNQEFLIWLTRL
jgi:23S rRNA (cytidine1920-2'-O)/16S rRNA (cytidine1409-2'-O)-methyltransferase